MTRTRERRPIKPIIGSIQHIGAGRLRLMIAAVLNARSYGVQSKVGTGDWVSAAIMTGLMPGTTDTLRVRVVGGSTDRVTGATRSVT